MTSSEIGATAFKRQRGEKSLSAGKRRRCLSPPRCNNILRDDAGLPNSLPDPSITVDPDDYLLQLMKCMAGVALKQQPGLEMNNFFAPVTEAQIASYTMDVASATRKNDISTLKHMSGSQGMRLNCCNRFGETLLHIASRRGYSDMVEYLLNDANVSVRVIDDTGRTPIHDAIWNPTPQTGICRWIIERDPSLLFIKDKRGFTPLAYSRPEHWKTWRQFLFDNRQCLQRLSTDQESKRRFS